MYHNWVLEIEDYTITVELKTRNKQLSRFFKKKESFDRTEIFVLDV